MSRGLVVAGVMSGTSADGVDVAICRIRARPDGTPALRVLGHRSFRYPRPVREAVLRAMDARAISVGELNRLSWRLGAIYAGCVAQTAEELGAEVALAGCHGQTVYHQTRAEPYLGAPVRSTLQIGEAAVLAERLRCPVVSDFRPADLAAGGEGAPLVPMLDWTLFRSRRSGRVLQNIGGIANLTAIPPGGSPEDVLAFDTGPGNMVIDGCMRRLFGRQFDRGGAVARRGVAKQRVVEALLKGSYFSSPPPKSCGREQFGDSFVSALLTRCRRLGATDADVIATGTALTAESVLRSYDQFVRPAMGSAPVEWIAAGGGVRNGTLMRLLEDGLKGMGVRMRPIEELGVAAEAKEAVAFALLAWLTWHRRPGNLVAATGAARPVVLGKICFG